MPSKKSTEVKSRLHPRNKNRDRYDLKALIKAVPELKDFVKLNKYGDESVEFANPQAVKLLNKALLYHYYSIKSWEFPEENLCPPIPGRADYIHYMADLLSENNFGKIPLGKQITCYDIGTGACSIYPILGVTEYNWQFIGSDIDTKSIESAKSIVASNTSLTGNIDIRFQEKSKDFFYGIIKREDKFDLSICNPPFHSSAAEAQNEARRKIENLSGKKAPTLSLNFSGINNELIYDGGEYKFIHNMIRESEKFSKNCLWFSSLVSKQSNVKGITTALEKLNAEQIKIIPMGTGNKSTRIIAWTFLTKDERKKWREDRWMSKS